MAIPTILSGAAGRTIDDMLRVRGAASGAGFAFSGVAERGVPAHVATDTLSLLDDFASADTLRSVVNGAKPGLERALGAGQPHFSATLHARLGEIRGVRAVLDADAVSGARAIEGARFGMQSTDSLIATIDEAMPQLEAAARRTAGTRVAIGALGIGGGFAGVRSLLHDEASEGVVQAPGPIGEHGLPAGATRA